MSQKRFISFGILLLIVLTGPVSSFAQVNLQTGSAVFSIPMFSWQDNQSRLTSQVALSYNSGNGLKVNDVASDEGQGWGLVQGGVITRLQAGLPDDQQAYIGTDPNSNGTENDQDISKYPAGWLYETVWPGNGCPNALTKYPIYKGQNMLYSEHNITSEDRQQDYFSFQFNGKAGIFVLDSLGSGHSLGDNRLIIKYQTANLTGQNIRTTITSFTIQDADGLIYTFAALAKEQILHEDYCDNHLTAPMKQPSFSGGNVYYQAGFTNSQLVYPNIITSWYLTSITDPLVTPQRQITFGYNPRTINNTAGADVTYNLNGNYSTVSTKTSMTNSLAIGWINFPDSHVVVFHYATPRVDLSGDTALSTVDISYKGNAISEYQLNTTYFILNRYGTPSNSYENSVARLCLRGIKKIGAYLKADSPPYIFDYYLGSSTADDFVPPPFFYAKDIWGFYNGNNSVDANGNPVPLNTTVYQLNNTQLEGLCFYNPSNPSQPVLNPKTGYAQNGLLRQIIYPTGGTLSYTYTQNTGLFNTSSSVVSTVGGVHVSQTQSTDGGFSNGCSNPIITNYNYLSVDNTNIPSLWGLEMPVNEVTTGNLYHSEGLKWHWTLSCQSILGCCYWKYLYPGILSELQAVSLTSFQEVMQALAPYLGVVNIITNVMDVCTVAGGSTGFLAIAAVVVDAIGALLTIGFTCFSGDNQRNATYHIFYNTDLNGASPLPTQFYRVSVVEGTGGIGKTVHCFTDSLDYPLWIGGGQNTDFSNQQRFAPWAYGLPKYDSVYDVNNNPIKSTTYEYQFYSYAIGLGGSFLKTGNANGPYLTSCKCSVINSYSQNNTDWTDPNQYNVNYLAPGTSVITSNGDQTTDVYEAISGRAELQSKTDNVFRVTDATQDVQTITNYTYDETNFQVNNITTTRSDGNVVEKQLYYPDNYSTTKNTQIQALLQNNILNEPIDVAEYLGYGESMLNEKVNVYSTLANGNIVPATVLEQRFATPTSATLYSPDSYNPSSYHTIQTVTFSSTGDAIGVKDEGGRTVTNIYGVYDKYIVASVVNADPILDKSAYTSFEFGDFGGWYLSSTSGGPATPTYSSSAITGTESLVLNGVVLSAPLNPSDEYTLSFWATGTISVGGAVITKSQPTINGFTYYEYDIPAGPSLVSFSGNSTIDELRLYPKMARMKTTTYDPLIGETSECDENNRITYYAYDNLGRLQFVQDEYHNILKAYEYNNVSAAKQNGCPGTYNNKELSEVLTKSCSSGYLGQSTTYTVPANQFSSTISQQDADIQAEIYLLTNGQASINNNSSLSCQQIFYNIDHNAVFYDQSCPEGYDGNGLTYDVPAGKYWSIISQPDADQRAINELNANGQAYADAQGSNACTLDNNPDWTQVPGNPTTCGVLNGTAYTMDWAIDMNPNSSSYNTGSWQPISAYGGSCPLTTIYAKLTIQNVTYDDSGDSWGDLVVNFYLDAAGTQPAYANGLTINYEEQVSCSISNNGGTYQLSSNPLYGASVVLGSQVALAYTEPYEQGDGTEVSETCDVYYGSLSGTGFIGIN